MWPRTRKLVFHRSGYFGDNKLEHLDLLKIGQIVGEFPDGRDDGFLRDTGVRERVRESEREGK